MPFRKSLSRVEDNVVSKITSFQRERLVEDAFVGIAQVTIRSIGREMEMGSPEAISEQSL